MQELIGRDSYQLSISADANNESFVEVAISSPNFAASWISNMIKVVVSNLVLRHIMLTFITRYEYNYKWQLGFLILTIWVFKNPAVEKVTVIRNYGIQMTSYDGLIILPHNINMKLFSKNQFIPREHIIDIIINEAFYKWFQVLFYLCIVIKDSKELKLMFPGHIRLHLEDQKVIYNICRKYLYTEEDLKRLKLKNKMQ